MNSKALQTTQTVSVEFLDDSPIFPHQTALWTQKKEKKSYTKCFFFFCCCFRSFDKFPFCSPVLLLQPRMKKKRKYICHAFWLERYTHISDGIPLGKNIGYMAKISDFPCSLFLLLLVQNLFFVLDHRKYVCSCSFPYLLFAIKYPLK